jgi:hypothetical protein
MMIVNVFGPLMALRRACVFATFKNLGAGDAL